MRKVFLILVIAILVFSGCGDKRENLEDRISQTIANTNANSNSSKSATNKDTSNSTVTQYQPTIEEKIDTHKEKGTNDIIDFTYTSIYRISDIKDKDGRYEPPYIEAGVMFTMHKKPEAGALVTIVPIAVDIHEFSAPIQKIKEGAEDISDKSTITWFNIEVGDIVNKEILSCSPIPGRVGECPFDVCCIYPAVEYARNLDIRNIKTEDLPNEAKKNIKCAIDVNKDNNPDLLVTVEKDSDYTVSFYYIKQNGKWKVFKQNNPM